jgi:hypothetical protein
MTPPATQPKAAAAAEIKRICKPGDTVLPGLRSIKLQGPPSKAGMLILCADFCQTVRTPKAPLALSPNLGTPDDQKASRWAVLTVQWRVFRSSD